jgi:hypothetical protein
VNNGQEGPDAIYGELRAPDGSVAAGPVVLDLGYGIPAVAYDPRHDQYLLVVVPSEVSVPTPFARLVGVRLDGDLHPLGPPFFVSHRPDVARISDPAVVYRPAAQDFVATWTGEGAGGGSRVYAQRVSASGTPFGPEDLPVSSGADAAGVDGQGLAASNANVDAVVAWGSGGTVYARRLGRRLSGGPLRRISGPADTGGNPAVAYQPRAREWLVAWNGFGPESPVDDDGNPVRGIFGQHMSTYFRRELGPDSFPISETLVTKVPEDPAHYFHQQGDPAVAADGTSRRYLIAWTADYFDTAGDLRTEVRRVTAEPPR